MHTRKLGMAVAMTIPLALIMAAPAQASTAVCVSTGPYVTYCGTQADNGPSILVLDSRGGGTGYNGEVIGWTDSATDTATDWFQLPYLHNNALGVMFEFAPGGHLTNMCVSDPGGGYPADPGGPDGLVLRPCNGSDFQRFVAAQAGSGEYSTWTNRATHRVITASGKGGQLTTEPATSDFAGGRQEWAFSN